MKCCIARLNKRLTIKRIFLFHFCVLSMYTNKLCYLRGILNDITEDMANHHTREPAREVEFITDSPSNSRSSSPLPCSSKQLTSPSKRNPTSNLPLGSKSYYPRSSDGASSSNQNDSDLTSTQPQSSLTTIINGEIVPGQSQINHRVLIDPSKLNVTFRLPDSSRKHVTFPRNALSRDLYAWLQQNSLGEHVIWTQFPKTVVPNDATRLAKVLGCNRVMLYVEEME